MKKSSIQLHVEKWRAENWTRGIRFPHAVYFVGCGEFVKIGIASNLRSRVKGMETDNPFDLTLLAFDFFDSRGQALAAEANYHVKFAAAHHRGEWFRLTQDIAAEIRDLCEKRES